MGPGFGDRLSGVSTRVGLSGTVFISEGCCRGSSVDGNGLGQATSS
jgi:hypothetical protein